MTLFWRFLTHKKNVYEELLAKSCQKNPFFWPKSRKNSENWQNLIIMSGNFGLLNRESGISEKFTKSTDFTP